MKNIATLIVILACISGITYAQKAQAPQTSIQTYNQSINSVGKPLPKDAVTLKKAPARTAESKGGLSVGKSAPAQKADMPAKNAAVPTDK